MENIVTKSDDISLPISFQIEILDNNPICNIHNLPISAVCLQSNCNKNGGICINYLLNEHFEDHDKNNIITLKELLEQLDEFFVKNNNNNNIFAELLETKTIFIDVFENYKIRINEKVDLMKNLINEKFANYEDMSKNNLSWPEYIYSEAVNNSSNLTKE